MYNPKVRCCTTSGVINKLSACLCLRTKKQTAEQQEAAMQKAEQELIAYEMFYEGKVPAARSGHLQSKTIPRIPLNVRMRSQPPTL